MVKIGQRSAKWSSSLWQRLPSQSTGVFKGKRLISCYTGYQNNRRITIDSCVGRLYSKSATRIHSKLSLNRYNASVLLAVIYGHRISSFEDEYYKLAESIDVLHPSVNPTLMDASPYCKSSLSGY